MCLDYNMLKFQCHDIFQTLCVCKKLNICWLSAQMLYMVHFDWLPVGSKQ